MGRAGPLALLALWLWLPPAAAAALVLGETERREAIRFGEQSIISDQFGGEWRVADPQGQTASVMTPFHRLALAARNAAFKREPLKPKDVESILKETRGKLAIWVELRGDRPDFARLFVPRLRTAGAEVKASFVQNERTARRDEEGRYVARCLYVFPTETLAGASRVMLSVRDLEDRERAAFTFDLSAMR